MKKIKITLTIIALIILINCNYKFNFLITPDDTALTVDNKIIKINQLFISNKNKIEIVCKKTGYVTFKNNYKKALPFGIKTIQINLKKKIFEIKINTLDQTSDIILENGTLSTTPSELSLEYGDYDLTLKKEGYPDNKIIVEAKRTGLLSYRINKSVNIYKEVGVFDCGEQPKQIIFSPDNKCIYIILLDGLGYQVFDLDSNTIKDYIKAPDEKNNKGFPEGLFIPDKNVFWISQMTTGKIYEYSYPGNEYKRTIDTKGIWSKYMAWEKGQQIIAVSNWSSNNVSIIDYSSGEVIKSINTAKAPRGLIFSSDGKFLYVTSFEGGMIQKFSTESWKEIKRLFKQNAAMRHVVISNDDSTIYVSNMYHSEIYEIKTLDFSLIKTYKVFSNPNTIEITPDNKTLFVSCRGPNGKETYLTRSPKNGKILVIDLVKKAITSIIDGGNQPTGLDISSDGKYLSFSNFRDNNFEIYNLKD